MEYNGGGGGGGNGHYGTSRLAEKAKLRVQYDDVQRRLVLCIIYVEDYR